MSEPDVGSYVGCMTQFSCLLSAGCYVYPPGERQRDVAAVDGATVTRVMLGFRGLLRA
jgi:hypothetical protein